MPGFFPWCRKLTVSKQEAAAICHELMAGNDARARQLDKEERISIDFANGVVLPLYVVCARANPKGECAVFEARRGIGP